MEINIIDYLSQEEIKEIVSDELRVQIRQHFKNEENARRLLSNLTYQIVTDEVDKIVPNHKEELVSKVVELISKKDLSYHLFDFDTYGSGKARSLGAKIMEEAVRENKQLIKDKVVETIQNRDYNDDAWNKFENLAETFTSNIYDFVDMMRTKKE